MSNAGVTFDDFRSWAETTGLLKNADSLGSYSDLPTDFCETLAKDTRQLGRCIRIYGKK